MAATAFHASVINNLDGDYVFRCWVEAPLYPGVSIRYKGGCYKVAADRTLQIPFKASTKADLRGIQAEITHVIEQKHSDLRSKLSQAVGTHRDEVYAHLDYLLVQLDSAAEDGSEVANDAASTIARMLMSLGDKSSARMVRRCEARAQKHIRAETKKTKRLSRA